MNHNKMKQGFTFMAVIVTTITIALFTGCKKENIGKEDVRNNSHFADSDSYYANENILDFQYGDTLDIADKSSGTGLKKFRAGYYIPKGDGTGWIWIDWPRCRGRNGNCLKEVVVYADRGDEDVQSLTNSFMKHYQNKSLSSFFRSDESDMLFSDLRLLSDAKKGLIDGSIVLHDWFCSTDTVHYFIALPSDITPDFSNNMEEPAWQSEVKCLFRIKDLR